MGEWKIKFFKDWKIENKRLWRLEVAQKIKEIFIEKGFKPEEIDYKSRPPDEYWYYYRFYTDKIDSQIIRIGTKKDNKYHHKITFYSIFYPSFLWEILEAEHGSYEKIKEGVYKVFRVSFPKIESNPLSVLFGEKFTTINKINDYLKKCFESKMIDLEEFTGIFAEHVKEMKEVSREILKEMNEIIKKNPEIKKIPEIKEILEDEEDDKFTFLPKYVNFHGYSTYLLPVDNELKVVSNRKIKDFLPKEINGKISYFDPSDGEIKEETLTVYIYDIKYIIKKEPKEPIKTEFSLEDFKNELKSIEKFNIYYPDEIVRKFYAGINSGNKFVILSGATGTGKTLLSILYPCARQKRLSEIAKECKDEIELKDKIMKEDYICFVRVQPNWTTPKDIIGYYNPIKGEFVKGILYDFLIKANNEKDKEFFLILDEMNLSHPEHYLSDIISAMETKGEINIHNSDKIRDVKKNIPFPKNLSIIGTINIDETTKELSPRLKSRAFLIELRVDFDKFLENCKDENKEVAEILKIIDESLKEIELGVGYRDINHISEYIKNGGLLDDALIQKIIPRIRTTDEKFKEVAEEIIKNLENKKDIGKFIEKMKELKEKFELQGFI